MEFNPKYLPKSDVVFSVMFLNKELCEKTLEIILNEHIELVDVVNEFKNDLRQAALNSIYFDVKTKAKDGRIITLDLQRQYLKKRVRYRTVYYACREVAAQKVVKSKYENLKSVVVTFILTEASLKSTKDNRKITLQDAQTNEEYCDLFTIHEINIKQINNKNSREMLILRDFFEISSQSTYNKFVSNYSNTEFGNMLLKSYSSAVNNTSLLDNLVEEEKFMYRLSEEERQEERQEGRQEGIKEKQIEVAKNLLDILTDKIIAEKTGLSINEVIKLRENQNK